MKAFLSTLTLASLAVLNSCALITTPVKVAGTAATTTIKTTGKVVGAGAQAISGENKQASQDD